jgi:hypothetical protein
MPLRGKLLEEDDLAISVVGKGAGVGAALTDQETAGTGESSSTEEAAAVAIETFG